MMAAVQSILQCQHGLEKKLKAWPLFSDIYQIMKVLCSILVQGLSVSTLCVLHVSVWVSSRGCSFLPQFINMQPRLIGYSKLHLGVNVSCLSLCARPEITWWPVSHLHPVAAGRGFSSLHPCVVKAVSDNGQMDVGVMISVWHVCFHSHKVQVG